MACDSTFSEVAFASAEPGEDDGLASGSGYLDRHEERLIGRILRGDDRAFARLVRRYQDRVFSLCLRMLGSREEAEDLAQEIFVAVHANLRSFRAESRLSTWIFKVSRNRCLNRLKYLSRRTQGAATPLESVSEGRLGELAGAPLRPDDHFEGRELEALLEGSLARLPEEQRLLVLLRDVDGLSYDEIAEVCELPVGTVKSRLHRARATLAEAVLEYRAGAPAPASSSAEAVAAAGGNES